MSNFQTAYDPATASSKDITSSTTSCESLYQRKGPGHVCLSVPPPAVLMRVAHALQTLLRNKSCESVIISLGGSDILASNEVSAPAALNGVPNQTEKHRKEMTKEYRPSACITRAGFTNRQKQDTSDI